MRKLLTFPTRTCTRAAACFTAWPRHRIPAPPGNWSGKRADNPAPNVHDAWITERLGTDWGEPGISLGVAPNDPNICYRTDLGRTMRTLDGGRTWDAVYSTAGGRADLHDYRN